MRVKSRFSDYYDSCLFMCGENLFFERNTDCKEMVQHYNGAGYETPEYILKLKKEVLKITSKYLKHNLSYISQVDKEEITKRINFALIIIGEKIIPLFELLYWAPTKGWIYEYYYSTDSFEFSKYNNYQIKYCDEHLKCNYIDLYNKVRKITNIPILYVSMNNCILNPRLKDFGLQKEVLSSEIIQELELFLNKKDEIVENPVTDKIKLNRNGFDDKSFKK